MRKLSILIVLIIISPLLFAIPANPEPGIVTFSDGSELLIYLRGDEYQSWHETEDGHDVIKNQSGKFEYVEVLDDGTIRSSGIIAHAPEKRNNLEKSYIASMPKNIVYPKKMSQLTGARRTEKMSISSGTSSYEFEQTTFPTIGNLDFLVIMVEFSDKRFKHTKNDFDNLMNAENYTYQGATGSVRKFFNATSFDRFNPHFDVVGPIVLDEGYAYYGENLADGGINTEKMQILVNETLEKADPIVDYSQYDNNNDGLVDNIYIIYAGYSEANWGADENTIWPHRGWLNNPPTLDGKIFEDYSISQELLGISGTDRSTIGVVCHEFSHVLGLWDYYDTDYSGSGGQALALGSWDLMANGVFLDGGNCPPLHNSWSRMFLKWAEPVELLNPENVIINPTYSHNEARYFHSPTEGEFFFLENRQKGGWDQSLLGHGLLIYHIDKNNSGWNYNKINCVPDKQGFDLEEALGDTNTSYHFADMDPFPGRTTNRSFTDLTSPNSIDWAGNDSNCPITSIQENEGVISFVFKNADVDTPENFEVLAQGFSSIDLSWTLNAVGDSVIILWSDVKNISKPVSMKKYDINEMISGTKVLYKGIETNFNHLGLSPGSINYYSIYSFSDSSHVYSARTLKSISTNSPEYYKTAFESGLPSGWITFDRNANGSFTSSNPLGRVIASTTESDGFLLIDSENAGDDQPLDAELITQSFNFGLSRSLVVKFQHRLEVLDSTIASFSYTVNGGLSWIELERWTNNTGNPELFEINLSDKLAGSSDVQFKFTYQGDSEKFWCVDDFEINSALDTGCVAGFFTPNRIGPKPLNVKFINTSVSETKDVDSYLWELDPLSDFCFDKDPEYTYTLSGLYSISLRVMKNGKSTHCIKNDYIIVTNQAPVILRDDLDTLNVLMNQPSTLNLSQVFYDPNGGPISFYCNGNSANLDISMQDDSLMILTPGSDFTGIERLELGAIDDESDSTSFTMDVWVSETAISDIAPINFECMQNFPNPFNPTTHIKYQLPLRTIVTLNIYDLKGHKVRTLVSAYQEAGFYNVSFHAADLPSGMYVYRISAGNDVVSKKMVLLK